ncbi:LOW QUALITY PROTEIN: uncharacterized protein LOC9651828 [Selaginella moellendorffii]|uniref:LOW QUALITY PROTEIN: uncharacterized protein LOC9651828 n=1 Tax=Selaginella moellendorffii TaxID=88036 RepID=UPI000D1CA4DA|nr:LOW QUALITY PROTEIN: uncharacterized protein LOC9651828 [Selaginella moellendorffii]|eukprot:XP_024517477.1 LOW QUALITY PROTEIN: uncharacterized protein LOC9651828 [Selaginella moellendorffii]
MALQVSAGYKRDVLAAMEGNEELEEGEACDANDSNYGSDLCFPHLEHKLAEFLGHARKDFEGGYYPEKLGSKYGGYGTFLPTVPAVPPPAAAAGRRLSPLTPCRPPGITNLEVAKQATTTIVSDMATDQHASPSAKPKLIPDSTGTEVKSSITLRIKMGSEGRGRNAAIYNRLGFSSPSASEGEDDDLSGPESSPDRSPASMIQIILSHRLPPDGLLSPLPDLTLRPVGRSIKVADSGSTKTKERRQSRITKMEDDNLKDLSEDSGRKDMELDRRQAQVKQEVQEVRKEKIKVKSQDEAWKFVSIPARAEEQKMPAKEVCDLAAEDKATSRKDYAPVKELLSVKDVPTTKLRRDEASVPEVPKEAHPEKRKQKENESEKRAKKRPKVNSSSGMEASASKEGKKSRAEDKPPKSKDEKKKEKSAKQQTKSELSSEALRRDNLKEDPVSGKARGGKSKGVKRSKDFSEPLPLEMTDCSDIKFSEPPLQLQQPVAPPDVVPLPPAIINENWVECDDCHTWRLLPPTMDPPKQSDRWRCEMITWLPPGMNNCRISEEESTNAVYNALGISSASLPAVQFLAPPAHPPPPVAEMSSKLNHTKKAPRPDYNEEAPGKSRALDVKPAKHAVKKKEKSKKHSEVDESRLAKNIQTQEEKSKDPHDKAKKKKRALSEDIHMSKKMRPEDGSLHQRGRYPHADIPNEETFADEDAESHEKSAGKRPVDAKGGRKDKPDESRKDRRVQDVEGSSQRARYEDSEREEAGKASKLFKPEKSSTRGKAVRVVDRADIQPKTSSRLSNDGVEPRKKKGSENCSPSYESVDTFKGRGADDARNAGDFSEKEARRSHPEHGKLLNDWDEFNEQSSWDEDMDKKQQAHQKAGDQDRYRHGEDKQDREGAPDDRDTDRRLSTGANGLEERGRAKEDKSSRKSVRSSEGRLKNAEALKGEHEEFDKAETYAKVEADRDRRSGKEAQRTNPSEEPGKKGVAEILEGKHDAKDYSLANNAIKAAKNLKHHADRLKDETAKDIYLQAALKFLQGGALVENVSLYNDTADLFKFCASQYERANDMPGALLAYKCAAVARFRMALLKNSSLSRDRRELHSALHRAPAAVQATPPTGESPSSSSASDLDNLNSQMLPPVDKTFSSTGKGPVSPLVQSTGTVPPALQPTLARFVRNTADVFEAFDIWNKAESVLAAVVAAKVLTPDKVAALEKVCSIGFSDVEALVRLVNQALEALGR